MNKGILFVAKDVAPSQALDLLSMKIAGVGNGYVVSASLAFGKGFPVGFSAVLGFVSRACAVVVGMSSSEELAKEEIAVAKEALAIGIPVYCYADTFGLRPHFSEILSNRLTTLFCVNDEQARLAMEKYPNLKVVVTGNPAWEQFFFPKLTREQSREKLGIGLEETVILLPAGKDVAVNIIHFNAAIESYTGDKVCHLIISLRPGDSTPLSIYQTLVDFAPENVKVRIVPASEMSASDILSGADVVFSSASTLEIEALCRKNPIFVVSYLSAIARRRLKKATGSDGWELVEMGVVYDLWEHDGEIELLPDSDANIDLESIRKHFPKPEKLGIAIDKMVDAILN